MEWTLLFVPLDIFERGVQQFGPSAKELALTGNIAGMAITLFLLGYWILRRGNPWTRSSWRRRSGSWRWGSSCRSPGWLLRIGLVPTGGPGQYCLFRHLRRSTSAVLATVLFLNLAVRVRATSGSELGDPVPSPSLRSRIAGYYRDLGNGGLAWPRRRADRQRSPMAQAPAPTAVPVSPTAGVAVAGAPPTAAAAATAVPLPVPPPARKLERDKDGSLTAGGRHRGHWRSRSRRLINTMW